MLPCMERCRATRGWRSVVMKPSEDARFMALVGDSGAIIGDSWEDTRNRLDREIGRLEDEIDSLLSVLQYVAERSDVGREGWECSGCKTGTLSRCLSCDEPVCGICLIIHECALVTA